MMYESNSLSLLIYEKKTFFPWLLGENTDVSLTGVLDVSRLGRSGLVDIIIA
jgi:hypothetical protein